MGSHCSRREKPTMGKPYALELKALPNVYRWAVGENVDRLLGAIERSSTLPMIATGSGGAFTAAHLASCLHQKYSRNIAKADTPLETLSSFSVAEDISVLCVSAGGRNKDILGAVKQLVWREPRELTVICGKPNSPLSQLVRNYSFVNLIEFDLPSGKDGFLATNSLVAFSVILCRAYARAFQINYDFPKEVDDILGPSNTFEELKSRLREQCRSLWDKQTVTVLYGPSTYSAALDLESKFSEAALGNIQMADYRNFAHGRHHWLAKRGDATGILALISDNDRVLAQRTLDLIPSRIEMVRVEIQGDDLRVRVSSLIHVLLLVGLAGESQGIDPGRPKVPMFGRRLYNLRAFGTAQTVRCPLGQSEILAIERKSRTPVDLLARRGDLDNWVEQYQQFIERISSTQFQALALDFDGTLCDANDRFTGIRDEIADQLTRILKSGGLIGVATGRGKSVKEDLRSRIPKSLWKRLLVGYYNGADIGFLCDDDHPDPTEDLCDDLREVARAIKGNRVLSRLSKCTFRKHQITIEPVSHSRDALVWDLINHLVRKVNGSHANVVRSSHSIDVLAPLVSKVRIVERLSSAFKGISSPGILCIGDKGKWPGNDFDLLREPCSLSVDQVSVDSDTCWNLAPPGHRGVQATLGYLRALSKEGDAFRLSVKRIETGAKV
jgi:hypothetical protein